MEWRAEKDRGGGKKTHIVRDRASDESSNTNIMIYCDDSLHVNICLTFSFSMPCVF